MQLEITIEFPSSSINFCNVSMKQNWSSTRFLLMSYILETHNAAVFLT